jgi:two-component system, NarL family, invasion response regulator UvrY
MTVLIADNQPLTYAGLLSFLSERPDISVLGQVVKPEQLSSDVQKFRPNLLITDYNLPGYITVEDIEAITSKLQTNVLVISSDNDKSTILKVLQMGVKGYLTKECSKDEVLLAIQSTARGDKFFCHKILDILMEKHFPAEPLSSEPTVLTTRESEILTLLAGGKSTQQIADSLHLSPHTVQTHRKSIIRKLNIKSPTEFVVFAMDLGLMKSR